VFRPASAAWATIAKSTFLSGANIDIVWQHHYANTIPLARDVTILVT